MNDHYEFDFIKHKNKYVKRRNTVRKLFLFLFIILCFFFLYEIIILSKNINLKIEVINNKLLSTEHIEKIVVMHIGNKNFFQLSPREISSFIVNQYPVFNYVIVRKYLLPHIKLLIIVKEKDVWGKLVTLSDKDNDSVYVTNEGDLITLKTSEVKNIPRNIVSILVDPDSQASVKHYLILNKIFKFLCNELDLKVNEFMINKNLDLWIIISNGYKIHAGNINENVFKNISKLKLILKSFMIKLSDIDYLDLTIETGVILKKLPKLDKKKNTKGLFQNQRGNKYKYIYLCYYY